VSAAPERSMKTVRQCVLAAFGVLPLVLIEAVAQARPPGAKYVGRAFEFRPVAEGVYFAVGTGNLSAESNAVIVVNDADVLVVDGETSPAAGWALLEELKTITPKPVRYVVLTHFHYDHAHGTQAFPPGTEIIGTEFTRQMIATGKSVSHPTAAGNRAFSNAQITSLTQALDTASSVASRQDIEHRRSVWQEYVASLETLQPVPPNVTVSGRMTLIRGNREIVIQFPGPAHTAGDLVVWLPKERILVTGDVLQSNLPYMGDGFLNQWADALDSLQALHPAVILPGHGDAITDMAIVHRLRDYLRDVWKQSAELKRQGLSYEEAAKRLDLTKYDRYYPRYPGWTDEIVVRRRAGAVKRVYDLLDGGS
jgi:glyoxylase-like metal-dependent hydrolase (beta-lactamase superfamily II)